MNIITGYSEQNSLNSCVQTLCSTRWASTVANSTVGAIIWRHIIYHSVHIMRFWQVSLQDRQECTIGRSEGRGQTEREKEGGRERETWVSFNNFLGMAVWVWLTTGLPQTIIIGFSFPPYSPGGNLPSSMHCSLRPTRNINPHPPPFNFTSKRLLSFVF